MASMQCCVPVDQQPCNQGKQNHSLGEKVTGWFKKEESTQCHSEKQEVYTKEGGVIKTRTDQCCSQTHTNCHAQTGKCLGRANGQHHHQSHESNNGTTTCSGKSTHRTSSSGERKKQGLFHRIKEKISGHSDDESCSSSSESDSDDEKCGKRKN